jgi:hypothetical protein
LPIPFIVSDAKESLADESFGDQFNRHNNPKVVATLAIAMPDKASIDRNRTGKFFFD